MNNICNLLINLYDFRKNRNLNVTLLSYMIFEIAYSFFAFILVFLVLRFTKFASIEGLNKWDLSLAFVIKSLASLFFIYIFTWYYGTGYLVFDSMTYINDAKILNNVFYISPVNYFKLLTGIGETDEIVQYYLNNTHRWSNPYNTLTNDAKNISRICSLIHFISFDCIYIHFIVFNLFALNGLKNIYLFFKQYIHIHNRIFFYSLILIPSLLFWGSGVLKEPMLIFAIGLFLRAVSWKSNHIIHKITFFIISIYILLNFKAYVLLSIITPFTFILLAKNILKKYPVGISLLVTFLSFILISIIFPKQRQKVVDRISVKQFDFNNVGKGGIYFYKDNKQHYIYSIQSEDYKNIQIKNDSFCVKKKTKAYVFHRWNKNELQKIYLKADTTQKIKIALSWVKSRSHIKVNLIFNSFDRLIYNIPEALTNSLFRPLLNDPGPKFKFLTFIETWTIFGFLGFALFKRRKLNRNELGISIALVLFIIILSLIIGWSTPVLGAIVRYRIPVYIAIVILAFILYNPPERLTNKSL